MLAAGRSLAEVSRRLGHSNVYVTASIYTHAISGSDQDAADAWEKYQNQQTATATAGHQQGTISGIQHSKLGQTKH